MILNKHTPNDLKGTFTGPASLEDMVPGKPSLSKFIWTVDDVLPICDSVPMVRLLQVIYYISQILTEADEAFVKITSLNSPSLFELKRLQVPSFDFFIYPYEPEMPPGVQCENLEQYLKLMFSQASSLSIMVREASPSRWEISCVDVEYKQSKRSTQVRKDDGH